MTILKLSTREEVVMFGEILQVFAEKSPITVMVHG
jgi:hypothetical protein